jgi:hypothetical protein
VWPFVDEWLAWFGSNASSGGGGDDDGNDDGKNKPRAYACENEDEADRRDLAAQGFLRLLKQLRVILLRIQSL